MSRGDLPPDVWDRIEGLLPDVESRDPNVIAVAQIEQAIGLLEVAGARYRACRLTISLVEQRVETLEPCDYVLETGRVALAGDRVALLADPRVQQPYLGA